MRQRPDSPKVSGCVGCPAEFDPCLWSGCGDNPAHLIVIANRPSGFSLGSGTAFFGSTGRLFRKLMDMVKQYQNNKYQDVKIYTTYSVLAGEYEPTAEHVKKCQTHLMRELAGVRGAGDREPVIVSLGTLPLRSLGIPATKITSVVGRVLTTTIQSPLGERRLSIIPVFEMSSLKKKPGLSNVVVAALLQATKLAMSDLSEDEASLDDLTKDYIFPKTLSEVRDLVDHIIGFYDVNRGRGPDQWSIGLDTETNTLHPYMPGAHTLMLSVAWDNGKAAAILLDHEETPYDSAAAWKEVGRLLACPKPKVFHNWKFDRKFLERVEGHKVNRVVWDTMLGEHYLDEDKKGLYSLKKLTNIYAPAYVGYDDELQRILRGETTEDGIDVLEMEEDDIRFNPKAPAGRDQALWDELIEVIAEKEQEKDKPAKQRDATLIKEANAKITRLYKTLDMKKPKKKPRKKEKENDSDGGFESVPLDVILRYAAIDADVTRVIMKGQNQRLVSTNTLEEGRSVMQYLYLAGSRTLSDMEYRGVKVDFAHLDKVEAGVTEMLAKAETALRTRFDPNVNYSSPPQVVKLMAALNFERIQGASPGSTGKDVLDRYVKHYPVGDHRREFAEMLLEFRSAHKAKTGFLRKIRRLAARDGRIHCTMHLNGTATGRLCVSGHTLLETSHGIFSISELDLSKYQNLSIMTHRGRMRRILRKYFKGFEQMIRIRLDDGSNIVCTREHRLLTPTGWRRAGESAIGSKICGTDVRGAAHPERTVVAIEDAGIEAVWDIEVEEDHSYVAQGMIHHNSSANPNMQNIPPYMCRIVRTDAAGKESVLHPGFNIKKIFVPSDPDNIMVNVDIKGAELRVYTAYSHDEKMIEALLQGLDIHSFTASKINKIPYEKVEVERYWDKAIKKKRDIAKRVVFGTFYGAGAFKIAEQIGGTKEEAQRVIDLLFEAFPALRQYIENTKQQVKSRQFVKTHFGRFRRFRLAHANRELFAEACREAVNFLIQSTASDLVLSQLCEVSDNLDTLGGKMLLTVHDSMTFELPRSMMDIQEVTVERNGSEKKILVDKKGALHKFLDKWIVERVKEKYDWLPVPFLYDVEAGPSYGEVREIERWTI